MNVTKTQDGSRLTIALSGRLNTSTAPQFEEELSSSIEEVSELVLDFSDLDYISSAGLRVVLSAQKTMNRKRGSMVVRAAKPEILEVFEMTGFMDFLTIE